MRILVLAQTRNPHRQSEALRAALGLTLRGATVEVAVDEPLLLPLAERSAAALRSFGHTVVPLAELSAAIARADVVEVWT
jgi:hypothetical protein